VPGNGGMIAFTVADKEEADTMYHKAISLGATWGSSQQRYLMRHSVHAMMLV
jgi:predicted lactoylglutathione lyase